ncbi:STE3-like pheromone receptor [Tricholoma matsutake]|nr:STE3-like pheromone receptor [Tricholoma matsutake 945]
MHTELPVVYFLCFALLVTFITTHRVHCNVANLAIVLWLAGYNLIHGINAFIWAGNVNVQVPVWCNIVTKLLLATIVAVSGAVLCISYRLEFLSSSRLILVDPKSRRNCMLIDVIFCYIIPIVYMAIPFYLSGIFTSLLN